VSRQAVHRYVDLPFVSFDIEGDPLIGWYRCKVATVFGALTFEWQTYVRVRQ
jgi:hypothetical protein